MQKTKNKKATLIALFLVLTIAVTIIALPLANAQYSSKQVPTWTYIGVAPDVIGVNEPVLIVFWLNFVPPTANGAYGDRWTFYVDITKPGGTNESLGPLLSDPVGGSWASYTPTQVGTYTLTARFIGKTLDNTPNGMNPSGSYSGSSMGNLTAWLGSYWLPSESDPATLTVQQEPMPRYQETPLPTGYWTRPVYGTNQYWGAVMGQWLNAGDTPGRVNAYTQGPESAHILWSRPYWAGGIMGGGGNVNFGNIGYYTGSSYEGYGGPSIILDGKTYYGINGGSQPSYGWYCVDLYSGKTLYYVNDTNDPAYGQVLDMEYVNQHGGFPYLWKTSGVVIPNPGGVNGTVWEMLDGHSGKSICKIANVSSSGTAAVDKIGSIVRYNIVNLGTSAAPKRYLQVWNTTQTMWYNPVYKTSGTNLYWEWRPASSQSSNRAMPFPLVFNGIYGFSLNVSIPDVQGSIRQVRVDQDIIGGTTGNITTNPGQNTKGNLWALSLKPGEEGRLLWNITFTPPPGLGDVAIQSIQYSSHDTAWGGLDADAGIFWFVNTMLRTRYVYNLANGNLLWTSEPESQWNFYGLSTGVYQGKLFQWGGYSGELEAYNATTGKLLWNWSAPFVGVGETPYTHTPLSLGCIADGKLYMYTSEHSITQPTRRDAKLYCVDAETGELIWASPCWPSSSPIIGDGRIVVLDLVDNMIYCYGRGSSKTTVSAPQIVPALGSSVTITGTVADDTPSGKLNTNYESDFTLEGTPAISDEDQEAWMDYLYRQRPIPTDAKGVEVSLDTIDPNGNYVHIGTVTSDINGNFGFMYTPEVPGTYQIIATFAGSAAYGPSSATTYLSVAEAPPATAAPEYPQPIDNTWTIVGVGIAMTVILLIAIVLIGIWIRRK